MTSLRAGVAPSSWMVGRIITVRGLCTRTISRGLAMSDIWVWFEEDDYNAPYPEDDEGEDDE